MTQCQAPCTSTSLLCWYQGHCLELHRPLSSDQNLLSCEKYPHKILKILCGNPKYVDQFVVTLFLEPKIESDHHDHSRLQLHKLTKRCEAYKWQWTVLSVPVGDRVPVCQVNPPPWISVPFGTSPHDMDTLKTFPSQLARLRHIEPGLRHRERDKLDFIRQRIDLDGWLQGRR